MAYTTRRSLLAKVRNGDETSWQEFYELMQTSSARRDTGAISVI